MSSPSPSSDSAPPPSHAPAVRALVATLVPAGSVEAATREALARIAGEPEASRDTARAAARAAAAEHVAVAPRRRRRGGTDRGACAQGPRLLAAQAAGTLGPATATDLERHLATCDDCTALRGRFVAADAAFDAAWDAPEPEPEAPVTSNAGAWNALPAEPAPAARAPSAWSPPEDDPAPTQPPPRTPEPALAGVGAGAWSVLEADDSPAGAAPADAAWAAPALGSTLTAEADPEGPEEWQPAQAAPVDPASVDLEKAPGFKPPRDRRPLRVAGALVAVAGLLAAIVVTGVFDKQGSDTKRLPLAAPPTADEQAQAAAVAESRAARVARRRDAARARAAARRRSAAARRRTAAARRRAGGAPVQVAAAQQPVAPAATRPSGSAPARQSPSPEQPSPKLQPASPPATRPTLNLNPPTSNPAGAQPSGETGRSP